MVPTLSGRIQTRLFLLIVIGIPWTLIITPLAPHHPGASIGHLYETTFWVLAEVIVVGCLVWEPLYHGLMQFRWEKDWPIMFLLLEGIPEGLTAYGLLHAIGPHPDPPAATTATFVVDFAVLWVLVWLSAIGPMRVLFHRWRFRGGQIL
jgi:hypothetical protein